jgi:hypothetical protein
MEIDIVFMRDFGGNREVETLIDMELIRITLKYTKTIGL